MKKDGSDETLTYSSNKRISQADTSILKCSDIKFEKTKIKILNLEFKMCERNKTELVQRQNRQNWMKYFV